MTTTIERLAELRPLPVVRRLLNATSNKLVMPELHVGVEVELETLTRHPVFKSRWNAIPEGSLHENGIEHVFAVPMWGKDIVSALTSLEKGYTRLPPKLPAPDASVHIHIDVRQMTKQQLTNFVLLNIMLEPLLASKYYGPRRNNPFCTLVTSCNELEEQLGKFLAELWYNDRITALTSRYSNINLNSVGRFGSVEFRGHPCEFRKAPLLEWINVLQAVYKTSVADSTLPPEKPHHALKDHDANNFLLSIFGQRVAAFDGMNVDELIDAGVRTVRRVVTTHLTTPPEKPAQMPYPRLLAPEIQPFRDIEIEGTPPVPPNTEWLGFLDRLARNPDEQPAPFWVEVLPTTNEEE